MRSSSHRDIWKEHARFPEQALLLESHDGFLAALAQFEERLAAIADGSGLKPRQVERFAGRLASEFEDLQWTMSCHERYEENKLYPFLDDRFGSNCIQLAEQHTDLHELGSKCKGVLARAASRFADTGVLDLDDARREVGFFGDALASHLAEEEKLVIPLLLSLSSNEFQRFSGTGESCAAPGAS